VFERIRGSGDFKTNHSEHIVTFFPKCLFYVGQEKECFQPWNWARHVAPKMTTKKEVNIA